MTYANVSPFVEAQLIVAAQERDLPEMERMIADMLPGERSTLADACDLLSESLRGE